MSMDVVAVVLSEIVVPCPFCNHGQTFSNPPEMRSTPCNGCNRFVCKSEWLQGIMDRIDAEVMMDTAGHFVNDDMITVSRAALEAAIRESEAEADVADTHDANMALGRASAYRAVIDGRIGQPVRVEVEMIP